MTQPNGESVVMTHSLLKDEAGEPMKIRVAPSAVPIHMASGWMPEEEKVAEEAKPDVPADVAPATPAQDAAEGAKSTTKRSTAKES